MVEDSDSLARYLRAQSAARDCLCSVAAELRPGCTEREAARRLAEAASQAGARGFFHSPLAWFGQRAAFRGVEGKGDLPPGDRKLEAGDVFVLDFAPLFDGVPGDVTLTFGPEPQRARARAALSSMRAEIPRIVATAGTARLAAERIADCAPEGWESRQELYPFAAVGHRVWPGRWGLSRVELLGASLDALLRLGSRTLLSRASLVEYPYWSDRREAECEIGTGLWSVEPHIACGDLGAKWEELLLVSPDGVRWLDPISPLD